MDVSYLYLLHVSCRCPAFCVILPVCFLPPWAPFIHPCTHPRLRAWAKHAIGAAEIAHLKKFGKLLATFGTRMACLLRHLGQECSQRERREAYRLYAKARHCFVLSSRPIACHLVVILGSYFCFLAATSVLKFPIFLFCFVCFGLSCCTFRALLL